MTEPKDEEIEMKKQMSTEDEKIPDLAAKPDSIRSHSDGFPNVERSYSSDQMEQHAQRFDDQGGFQAQSTSLNDSRDSNSLPNSLHSPCVSNSSIVSEVSTPKLCQKKGKTPETSAVSYTSAGASASYPNKINSTVSWNTLNSDLRGVTELEREEDTDRLPTSTSLPAGIAAGNGFTTPPGLTQSAVSLEWGAESDDELDEPHSWGSRFFANLIEILDSGLCRPEYLPVPDETSVSRLTTGVPPSAREDRRRWNRSLSTNGRIAMVLALLFTAAAVACWRLKLHPLIILLMVALAAVFWTCYARSDGGGC